MKKIIYVLIYSIEIEKYHRILNDLIKKLFYLFFNLKDLEIKIYKQNKNNSVMDCSFEFYGVNILLFHQFYGFSSLGVSIIFNNFHIFHSVFL